MDILAKSILTPFSRFTVSCTGKTVTVFTYKHFLYIKRVDLFEFQYYEYFIQSFLVFCRRKMVMTVVGALKNLKNWLSVMALHKSEM